MSVFCCFRTSRRNRAADEDLDAIHAPVSIPLPTLPPPAKLPENPHLSDYLQPVQRADTVTSLRSNAAPSSNYSSVPRSYRAHLHPGELVSQDHSDTEADLGPNITRKASGALEAVRGKFLRSRSRDASSRNSRTSVGTSDEELARRAELKRLMHKRIQEELASEAREEYRELSGLSSPSPQPTPPLIFGGGPRDLLEFSMADASVPDDKNALQHQRGAAEPGVAETHENGTNPRESSGEQICRDATHGNLEMETSAPHLGQPPGRESPSLRPLTPMLCPVQGPVIPDTASPVMWRLSSSDTPHERDINAESTPVQGQPPTGAIRTTRSTWHMVQNMRAHNRSLSYASENLNTETFPRQTDSDSTSVMGGVEAEIISIGNHQTGSLSLEPGLPPTAGQDQDNVRGAEHPRTIGSGHGVDQTSSRYPSMMSTRVPTPTTSSANSDVGTRTRSLHGLQLSPFKCKLTPSCLFYVFSESNSEQRDRLRRRVCGTEQTHGG